MAQDRTLRHIVRTIDVPFKTLASVRSFGSLSTSFPLKLLMKFTVSVFTICPNVADLVDIQPELAA